MSYVQVDDGGVDFDGQDVAIGADNDDADDDGGGVDFGLSVADYASESQFVTSQVMDDVTYDGSVLVGDNLLAVPRKVNHDLLV